MANLYVQAESPTDLNKNTEWFMYPGVWTIYILILFFSWLVVLSLFGCSPGMAWTTVNLSHFLMDADFGCGVALDECECFVKNLAPLSYSGMVYISISRCIHVHGNFICLIFASLNAVSHHFIV
ncbi:hypothetical protein F511_05166 [Dorcoceras hygrometricum]|uniref:Uncharacterized protein n=1 Tax=Dorcoceras hygrometricum TaxID=472368 RepID=A0A2Z7C4T7_9LAMI|nr:hypothetical protein F511_05166 [Dorcoceras hygrometricum]